ncbi:MAG: phosphoglucosamine mutase [Bacilli bacterium]
MGKYFGTDGVRGPANEKLTAHLAYRIGRFIGQYPHGKKTRILVGRDTRLSGSMLDNALIAGITSSGGNAYELAVTTTPSISYLVEKKGFDFGVMISASHNPFFDNGIKIFAPNGEKLNNEIESLIEEYIDSPTDYLPLIANQNMGRLIVSKELIDEYLDYLASKAIGDFSHLKVAIDCAHGSASVTAKKLFIDRLHLKASIFNDDFNGTNINDNCGSTHLKFLQKIIMDDHYDLGIAFDGDADRCLFVNHEGQIVDGDATMFINARYMRKHHLLKENKIVLTVMSNLGLKKALMQNRLTYEEVSVGDKYVQACLKEKKLSLGGEQSGHVIFNDDLNTGDGQLTAIHTLNILAAEKKSLKELTEDLIIYPQILKNIGVSNKEAVMKHDGLKVFIKEQEDILNGNGRILVRPSGTEQLIRVMVEASTCEDCANIADKILDYISNILY